MIAEGTRTGGGVSSLGLCTTKLARCTSVKENLSGQFVLGGREVEGMATEVEVLDVCRGS